MHINVAFSQCTYSYSCIVLSVHIFRSESPSQVFFIVLTWLIALLQSSAIKPEELQSIYLTYDMCNLCHLKVARKPVPLDRAWLRMNSPVTCTNNTSDSFHLRNHVNPECHTSFSPQTLKPDANTQAGEQTFVWMARYNNIVYAMKKTHHLFYLHHMIRRRNNYTAKCYANGRKPVLPWVKA